MIDFRSRSITFRPYALLVGCAVVMAACASWGAQQPKKKPPAVTKEFVQSRIQAVSNDATLKDKEPLRKQILDYYEQARNFLTAAEADRKRLEYLDGLEEKLPQLKQEVAKEIPIEPPGENAAAGLNLEQLKKRLTDAETELEKAALERKEWEREESLRQTRKSILSTRPAEVQKRLAEVNMALQAKAPANETPEVTAARLTSLRAEKMALEQEAALLNAESRIYGKTDSIVSEKIRAAKRLQERAKKAVQFWTEHIEKHRGTEADAELQAARTLKRNLVDSKMPDRLIEMAAENIRTAQRRTSSDGTIAQLQEATRLLAVRENELANVKANRKTLEDKLKIEGIERHLGPLLLKQRRKLPDVSAFRRRVRQRVRTLSGIRNDLLDVQTELNQRDEIFQQTLAKLPNDVNAARRTRIEVFLREILRQRETILKGLEEDYNRLENRLLQLSEKDVQIANAAEDFRTLIDKHILWIPTARPLWRQHPKDARAAVKWLVDPERWSEVGTNLIGALASNLLLSALALVLLAAALWYHRPIKRRLGRIGEQAAKGFLESYWLTLEALALTMLLTSIGPAICWFIGWNLETWPESTSFSESVGHALQVLALVGWSLEFLRRMLRPHGLAEAHFRWRDERLRSLRRHLRWFMATVLALVFLCVLIEDGGTDNYSDSLGRMLLMATLIIFSGFLAVVLRRGKLSIKHLATSAADHSVAENQMTRLQLAGYAVAVLVPLVLAGAAAAGYLYTAAFLTWKLIYTSWLCLALVIFHAMCMRWLYHARGRLALEQAQAAQAAAARAASVEQPQESTGEQHDSDKRTSAEGLPEKTSSESAADTRQSDGSSVAGEVSEPPSVPEELVPQPPVADLATINVQTRRLLKIAIGSAAAIGLWMIWADIMPALKFLDFPLWATEVETTRSIPGPNNTTTTERVTTLKNFTLADLLLSLVIIIVVFVAAMNLPGLLEVAVLQRLPLDSGARYAVTALARYTIYVVGVIYAFNMMGFGWSKVQWLVAALGVGLGFGLQEIFANFVSGIILLFERPLRIGDIVTVGDVSGTVARIQIRATTIRDWDRKEYVVPNKELVTGKLMNWTLSDSVTRLVFNVGISYSSDPVRARDVLLEVVTSHPNVLETPAVLVTFEEFADSALNFKVRCCVPSIGKRLNTLNDLHAQIHRRFAEEGISIPFPQRDLHIRSDATRENGRPLHLQESEQSSRAEPVLTPDPPEDEPEIRGESQPGRRVEESPAE